MTVNNVNNNCNCTDLEEELTAVTARSQHSAVQFRRFILQEI